MLCPSCAEIRVEPAGAYCPVCDSSLVPVTPLHLERLVQERFRTKIHAWRAQGLIDPDAEDRLLRDILILQDAPVLPFDVPSEGPLEDVPPPEPPPTLEQRADALAGRLGKLEDWRPTWGQSFFRALEARASRERAARHERSGAGEDDGLDLASDSGQALFHRVDAGALGGLEAMAALDGDAADTSDAAPRLHEYVWWFLGAVLVLGGSLMGVREAWRALGGVPRQVLVSGALFAYHAAFIGLGVFLARRSAPVGRVLASIGLVLLPVVSIALSSLVALEPLLGGALAAGFTVLTLLTLRPTARLLYQASTLSLGVAVVPSLLAGLPLMGLDESPWLRALCAGGGVVALRGAAWRGRNEEARRATLSTLITGLYGALFLAVFAVGSAPEGFSALSPGEPLLSGMTVWALVLAATVAAIAARPGMHAAHPRAAPVVETIGYAVTACATLLSLTSALSLPLETDPDGELALALTPMVAALAYFLLMSRRPGLVHAGALSLGLAGALLSRMGLPLLPGAWLMGLATVCVGLLFVARGSDPGHARPRLLGWGVVFGGVALGGLWRSHAYDAGGTFFVSVGVAIAAHVTGGFRWRGLHYLGGLGAFVASEEFFYARFAGREFGLWRTLVPFVPIALVWLYAGVGLVQEAWSRRRKLNHEDLLPLDDVSLALAVLHAWRATEFLTSPDFYQAPREPPWAWLGWTGPALVLVGGLLYRARRDRSRLVSALAAWVLACVTWSPYMIFYKPSTYSSGRLPHLAAVVLVYCLVAALRSREVALPPALPPEPPAVPIRGRKLIGLRGLPFAASGRVLYTDGFAAVALGLALLGFLWLVSSMGQPPGEIVRTQLVFSGGVLAASAGLAFLTRGFVTWRMRGSVLTLAGAALFVVLTAVINRLGRPLPPDVVALRLTGVGVGLWGVMLLARRFGPALARSLENPRQGKSYAVIPLLGVVGLGLLLTVEPLWVGGPELTRALTVVPPLFPLGAALLCLLLARTFRSRFLVSGALLLGLPGAALWAVHGTPLGHALVDLEPPNGLWARVDLQEAARLTSWSFQEAWLEPWETVASVWYRAFLGIAAGGLVYAAVALGISPFKSWHRFVAEVCAQRLQRWAGIAAGLVFLAAFLQPGLEAALLTLGSGLLLLAVSSSRRLGRQVAGLSGLLLVHALAHQTPVLPNWPGPVLALLGLGAVVLGPVVARWRKHDLERARAQAQFGALLYGLHALAYALASGGRANPEVAMPLVLFNALAGGLLEARWTQTAALPETLALVALTLFIGAAQWKGALARVGAAWGTLAAGAAVGTGLAVGLVAFTAPLDAMARYASLLSLHGPALALGLAGAVAVAHLVQRGLRTSREDLARGISWGRDVGLLATGGWLALLAAGPGARSEQALPLVLAALGVAVGVSLHAAWREQTGRHVYFVQVAAVGVYALVRALYARGLSPEHDALFALGLGFVLVGVTVLARRAGIPPVERATRRFAALLPLGMALVLPREATSDAALLAGGSSLLYAALGAVERSRWFGSLAAVACNAALLVGALSLGLEGIEIVLAPLGLLLLMLSQLFTRSLPQAARNALRVVGGLLLYVPAAAKVTLRVGMAEDGTYAVVFGAVCLLGVMVGMALRIRAYLALGTLFLTLDVAATLVHAGLRNHRVGFVVMTVAGLLIFTGRVMATLNRAQFDLLWRRARVAIRGWD